MRGTAQMPNTKIIHDPTTLIHNLIETISELQEDTYALVNTLDETDYKQDTETNEWHPVSIAHDKRRDLLDSADDKLRAALIDLNAAMIHSINIDK
jgi:hypothetical protein